MLKYQNKFLSAAVWGLCCALSAGAGAVTDSSLHERFHAADVVSLVRIHRVGNLVNPAMTSRGMMAVEALSYTAGVIKGWKGQDQSMVNFRVDFSDCVNDLQVGEQYLIFSRQNLDGGLQAYSCEDMIPAAVAQDLVAELNAMNQLSVAGTH